MTATVIRAARSEEAEAVRDRYVWLFAPPGSKPRGWDDVAAAERLRAAIAAEESTVLVAVAADDVDPDGRREERIIGFCTAYLDLLSVRYGLRCWVEDLAVDPGERSRGVGSALLGAALEFARARSASHLELDSGEARHDAHRFYEREGATGRSRCFGWHGLGAG